MSSTKWYGERPFLTRRTCQGHQPSEISKRYRRSHRCAEAETGLTKPHHILYVAKAVCAAEAQHCGAIMLQGELMDIPVPADDPWQRAGWHLRRQHSHSESSTMHAS